MSAQRDFTNRLDAALASKEPIGEVCLDELWADWKSMYSQFLQADDATFERLGDSLQELSACLYYGHWPPKNQRSPEE